MTIDPDKIAHLAAVNNSTADVPHTLVGPLAKGHINEFPSALNDFAGLANEVADEADYVRSMEADIAAIPAQLALIEGARDDALEAIGNAVAQGNVPIYATHTGFEALSIPAAIKAAFLMGYSAVGDGGQKTVKRVATQPASGGVRSTDRFLPNGTTDSTHGGWWRYVGDGKGVNVRAFGADPAALLATNVAAFQAAAAFAIEEGSKRLLVEGAFDLTGVNTTIHKVRLVGSGSISGVYRRIVVSPDEETEWSAAVTMVPEKHLRRTLRARDITAVMIGNSIAGPNVAGETDRSNQTDGLNEIVQEAVKRAWAPRRVNWINRAIGATRMNELAGIPAAPQIASAVWYTDDEKPWLEYVKDLQPDVVFLNMVMNDGESYSGAFPQTKFFSVFNQIRGWAKVPDIVVITDFLPSITNGQYTSKASQEGRDAVAGFFRSFCDSAGIGYIDTNRHFSVLRDGFDLMDCRATLFAEDVVQAIPYLPATECRDYVLIAEFESIASGFWDATYPFKIPLSPYQYNIATLSNSGGYLKVELQRDSTIANIYFSEVTAFATPAEGTDVVIMYAVQGNTLRIWVNGSLIFDGQVLRYGGLFAPAFTYSDGHAGMTGTFKLLQGTEAKYMPKVLDTEIYDSSIGGNGINHPTPLGTRKVAMPMIKAQRWNGEVAAVEPAGAAASRYLPWKEGFAADFQAKDYIIRDLTTPANDAQGDPASLITMHSGTVPLVVDATTGERLGLRLTGSVVGYIPLSGKPFNVAEGTLLVEACAENSSGGFSVAIGTDAGSGSRIQLSFSATYQGVVAVVDDLGATAASMSVGEEEAASRFLRIAFSWKANRFRLVVNGKRLGTDLAGSIPTGLTRLKLGHTNNASQGASASTLVRKVALVPVELPLLQMIGRTL